MFHCNVRNLPILLSLFLLSSCNCYQTHLDEEDKAWCAAYAKGDKIVFKSDLGNFDTITVTNKEEGFSNMECNSFEIGRAQQQYINIDLTPKRCHNPPYCEGEIGIKKTEDGETSYPFFRIFGLEYVEANKLPTTQLKLSTTGKTYDGAYYFEDQYNTSNYGNGYLRSFYWDKQDGLIRYDARNGEIFEFYDLVK